MSIVCRNWYPQSVVKALDSLGDRPWQDDHLFRAINASQGNDDVHKDLMRRISILRDLGDNIEHLLSMNIKIQTTAFPLAGKALGRRKLEDGEPAPPASEWDPTICIVGI